MEQTHKDIRIPIELSDRLYELAGFLEEGEGPIDLEEAFRRTDAEHGGAISSWEELRYVWEHLVLCGEPDWRDKDTPWVLEPLVHGRVLVTKVRRPLLPAEAPWEEGEAVDLACLRWIAGWKGITRRSMGEGGNKDHFILRRVR